MVFVLDQKKQPLSPCHPAKARKLLREGEAVIHRRFPFTIRLKETKSDHNITSEYRLKIDYGSKITGLAILKRNKVIWLAELHHKINIKQKLDERRSFRSARRNRKTRYRPIRFLNRKRKEGWIAPSLKSKVDNIDSWVNRLRKFVPLTHISYENVKFDTQLMRNPEINGIEYQYGTLQGYKVKKYLLEKCNRTCTYCQIRDVPLEVEHIIPKSRGGTDRIDNLTLACRECNFKKGTKTAEEFGFPQIQKQVKQSLKDAASINTTRWKVYNVLTKTELFVECGTGIRTKIQRIRLKLPKEHYYDAVCIGESTPLELRFQTRDVLHIQAKGRGSRRRTNLDQYGFPRGYLSRQKMFFGFQTGDSVKAIVPKGKYKGIWIGNVATRKTGSFDIKNNAGKRIAQGIHQKYFQITQRFDGYVYQLSKRKEETEYTHSPND